MDFVSEHEFSQVFERMISLMTDPENFDRSEFVDSLTDLAKLFHLSKGVTEFYPSVVKEQQGDGEIFCDFDDGRGGPAVVKRRFVTQSQAVIKGTLYRPESEPPLSEKDIERLDLAVRALLSFVSRNRLVGAIERFGFYDEAGYPNNRAFIRKISMIYAQGQLGGNYSVILFNLRHFTLINQDIGRQRGDMVMRRYCDMIKEIIGEDGILSRLGGDNFTLLFRTEKLEPILRILRGVPICYDDEHEKRVMISASTGVFTIPKDFVFVNTGDIMDKIISSSNVARHITDDYIVFFDESMAKRNNRAMRIQQSFPQALANREFKVYYQPKVDVETGRVVGAEALCRWFRDGKMIPPLDFIPVLELSTDVCRLDFYMLDSVCADIRRWLDTGVKPVRVSVNLSRKHLADIDLLEHIIEVVERHSVPHEYIEIELTETTTDVEFRDLKRVVSGLQQRGIRTSVDDFGVGYSSLNLIREIPWNVLKIDRCFLPSDEDSESSVTSLMYRHVVAMALELGLECITEGVETPKQIELLRSNHCRIAQGFIFDRPLPIDQFEPLLGDHRYDLKKIFA